MARVRPWESWMKTLSLVEENRYWPSGRVWLATTNLKGTFTRTALVVWARAGAAARAVKAKKAEKKMVKFFMVASPVFFSFAAPTGRSRSVLHGMPHLGGKAWAGQWMGRDLGGEEK